MIKLYSGPMSMFSAKALVAIREKALPCEVELVPFSPSAGYGTMPGPVLAANPRRQIPVIVDADHTVYDSTLIFEYLEDRYPAPPLRPASVEGRMLVRQLEHEADEVLFRPVADIINDYRAGRRDRRAEHLDRAAAAVDRLAGQMRDGAFLASDFSYADIGMICSLYYAEFVGADVSDPRLEDWMRRTLTRPSVAEVLGGILAYMRANGRPEPAVHAAILDTVQR